MPDIALSDVNAANYSAIVFVGSWGASQYQYAFTGTYTNPTNNIPAATLYRRYSEVNGATVYTGGVLGDPTTRNDDVIVEGRIITGENFDLFDDVVATEVSSGRSTVTS